MTPGFREILLIILVGAVLLYLPQLRGQQPSARRERRERRERWRRAAAGWRRLGILLSVLWLLATTVFVAPWDGRAALVRWVGLGLMPLLIGWGTVWVLCGFSLSRTVESSDTRNEPPED